MRQIKVLLLGAHINSTNLGCQALTYSLVNILEKISEKNKFNIQYYVFEFQPNSEEIKKYYIK